MGAAGSQADAAIVNGTVNQTVSSSSFSLTPTGSGATLNFISSSTAAQVEPTSGEIYVVSPSSNVATNFSAGQAISGDADAGLEKVLASSGPSDQFDGVTDAYLGFNGSSGVTGWVRLDVDASTEFPVDITIKDWAYQNDGSGINAGEGAPAAIPGPLAALAGLALGGVVAARRRKSA